MKTNLFILLFLSFLTFTAKSQKLNKTNFNLDFENNKIGDVLPDKWIRWGSSDYIVKKDSTLAHQGKYSSIIYQVPNADSNSFGSLAYQLPANYKGKNIRLEGYMKLEDVSEFAALLIRIDAKYGEVLEFNSLEVHPTIKGIKKGIDELLDKAIEMIHK